MITAGVVFIHPDDLDKLLKHDATIIDMIKRAWYDGLEVTEINGIVYRLTKNVPAVIEDWMVDGSAPPQDVTA